ncbi:sugar phosphate isomerase/epimerase [Candidatus Poribacteria bacterium]|nr:sugar phosphate isomerase/epimerase [Candidatus Poribacteria bacterium]
MMKKTQLSKLSKTPSDLTKHGDHQRTENSRYAVTVPFDGLEANLEFLRANNLDVEVMMYDTEWIRNFPRAAVEAMGKRLEAAGLGVSVHGPLFDLNPGSQDTIIRDYTKFNFMRSLNISALLKAKIVVFHLGLNPLIPQDYRDLWLKTSMKTWEPVVNHARRLGITIAIENMFLNAPYFLRKVIEMVDSSNMQVCLDVGHVNVYSVVPLEEWVDVLGKYIVKVHINDNDAQNDLHLAFGEGNIDYLRTYRLLREKNVHALMTLEMTPDKLPATLKYIKNQNLRLPTF